MITCIIAEKPSVARDIARIVGATSKQEGYLEGGGYLVTWAMGHLITLAMPEVYGFATYKAEDLPIRPNPFQLIVRQVRKDREYHNDPSALKQLKAIRSCFDRADRIIVATDAGREGELIFRWIHQYLNCQKPFDRLWISSLTDKAIREGFANLKQGSLYDNLYHSAQARAEADWLVGINAYVGTVCEELLSLVSEQKSYPTYRCPKCGNDSVGIYAKVAKCRNEGCNFRVFREVCGTFLSEDNLRDLIASGRTPILKGLTSKAGKKFNARLVLRDDGTTAFEFEQRKKK